MMRLTPVALLLGTGMVACTPMHGSRSSLAQAPVSAEQFGRHAFERASAAAAAGDRQGAIAAAEIAVATVPDRADYRAFLGQAYLDGGRFASADAAFSTALTLDPAQPRAAFGRVLALLGEGRQADARAAIASLPGTTPASDRGLATALAGDPRGAIAILDPAARAPGADARTRQNLALAYALAGDWAKASATAAQDIAPADLPARLAGWAQFAQAPSAADQVALLIGATPVADGGIPVQLALAPGTAAKAAPAPELAAAEPPAASPPVAVAVAAPQADALAPVSIPAPPPLLAAADTRDDAAPFAGGHLVQAAVTNAIAKPSRTAFAPPPLLRAPTAPYKRAAERVAFAAPPQVGTGTFVVQLGAYRDATHVERAWAQSTARLARLASYTPSSMAYMSAQHSATLTRLSIAGFGTRAAALAVCSAVKATGAPCFVRARAADSPVHWASLDIDRRGGKAV